LQHKQSTIFGGRGDTENSQEDASVEGHVPDCRLKPQDNEDTNTKSITPKMNSKRSQAERWLSTRVQIARYHKVIGQVGAKYYGRYPCISNEP